MKTLRSSGHESSPAFRTAALVSLSLHVLLMVLLVSSQGKLGSPVQRRKPAVIISLEQFRASPAPAVPAAAQPQKPPVPDATAAAGPRPPAQREPGRHQAPVPKSEPSVKPQPPIPPEDPPPDSLLGRIQDNWLRPPGVPGAFRCRLRIDYGAGGVILAVHLSEKCGVAVLDDSVTRAVWKSQPIPLPPHSAPSGTIDVEFSP